MGGGGLGRDGEVGAEQQEHARRVLGRQVHQVDRDTAIVLVRQGLGVVHLEISR